MGMWVGFFLSFGGWWWWVLLSADLKLGVFTGMNSGGLLGIPTQTELKQFLLFLLYFGPSFFQETHADMVACLHRAACNIRNCIFSFYLT